MKNQLKPYMVYDRNVGPQEGAVLVFAKNSKEAKKLGYKAVDCFVICEFIDTGVRRIWDDLDYFYSIADKEKLEKGIPHVIDNPPCCKKCGMWGYPLSEDGICKFCLVDDIINSIAMGGSEND